MFDCNEITKELHRVKKTTEESAVTILHMKRKAEGSATFNLEGLYLTFIYLVELFYTVWLLYFQIEFSSGNYYI